jgi:hypothetical protein
MRLLLVAWRCQSYYISQNISVIGHHLTSISVPCTVILSDVRDRVMIVSQAKVFFSLVILSILAGERLAVALCPSGWFPLQKSLSFFIIPNYNMPRGICQEESFILSKYFSTLLRHALNSSKPLSVIREPLSMQFSLYMSRYSSSVIICIPLYVSLTILQAEYNRLSRDCQGLSEIIL